MPKAVVQTHKIGDRIMDRSSLPLDPPKVVPGEDPFMSAGIPADWCLFSKHVLPLKKRLFERPEQLPCSWMPRPHAAREYFGIPGIGKQYTQVGAALSYMREGLQLQPQCLRVLNCTAYTPKSKGIMLLLQNRVGSGQNIDFRYY